MALFEACTPTAAVTYAGILRARTRAGSPIRTSDAIIAATALDAGANRPVTGNVRDFTGIGLELTDPRVASLR